MIPRNEFQRIRYKKACVFFSLLAFCALLISGCAAPSNLPEGPTPIPTLIPATEPRSPLAETAGPSFTIQSYPARLPSASLGQTIYGNMCASCHGEDGNGVVPGARNFGDLDYMRGETPAAIYAAISEGRGDMPAFRDRLSSDERWDVTFYVWRFSTDAEKLVSGQHIYDQNCTACHGPTGTGEVLGATDLSDLRVVDNIAPRDFYLTITQGKGSMPAWQGRLSQDERWAVIDYLRTFSYDPAFTEDTAVGPPPTPEVEATACDPNYLDQTNPFDWDDQATILAGKVIYDQACSVCHSDDGSGNLPGTPDYSDSEVNADLRENSGEALCIVAEGQAGMPGWKETLSTDQIWQVLTYIHSLGAQ